MKKKLLMLAEKYLALVMVFVIVIGVCLLFSSRKSGMFIDEIYTYGLSNSRYAPFLRDIKDGDMIGKSFTREELADYMLISADEGFDLGSVYYNQANDVHPPLYYWLFNAVSSVFRNDASMRPALGLDLVLYLITLALLWKLCVKLFDRRQIAAAVTILYGISSLGLSTMLMIRMYVLLTLLTVWLAYLIACQLEAPSLKLAVLSGLCIFLGVMTQYYFVFYAFFLCAAYVIVMLVKKQYRAAGIFSLCALAGVALLVPVFPYCLDHLFSGKLVSGGSALSNLTNFSQYAFRFSRFFGETRHGLKAALIIAILALVLLIVLARRLRLQLRIGTVSFASLVIIVPAFVTLVLVAVISPVDEARYIYNIAPIFVLAVGFLLYLLDRAMWVHGTERMRNIALLAAAVCALWFARSAPPEYLYPEYKEYDALVAEHSGDPCVYFNDNTFEAMTQDLLQLQAFDTVYVTDREHCADFTDYAGESNELVAYFDISEYWGSGYKPEELLREIADKTDFDRAEPLYQNGLSAAYILSK